MLDFAQYCILVVLVAMLLVNVPVQKSALAHIFFGIYVVALALLGFGGLVLPQLRQYFVLVAGLPIAGFYLRNILDKGLDLIFRLPKRK